MATTLLQFRFPFTGPWGEKMSEAMQDLAQDIANEEGLIWKIWTENEKEQWAGGVYMFRDEATAGQYRLKHQARLEGLGIRDIQVWSAAVNLTLSALTKAPIDF